MWRTHENRSSAHALYFDPIRHMVPTDINILKNIRSGTVPENVIILREQFLCRLMIGWIDDRC